MLQGNDATVWDLQSTCSGGKPFVTDEIMWCPTQRSDLRLLQQSRSRSHVAFRSVSHESVVE